MSIEGRQIDWTVPFGPVIMETTISDELHSTLLNRADQLRDGTHPNSDINTETNDYRGRLAGCLSEEYSDDEELSLIDSKKDENELARILYDIKTQSVKKESVGMKNQLINAFDFDLLAPRLVCGSFKCIFEQTFNQDHNVTENSYLIYFLDLLKFVS